MLLGNPREPRSDRKMHVLLYVIFVSDRYLLYFINHGGVAWATTAMLVRSETQP